MSNKSMMRSPRPCGDRVLVKIISEEKVSSGGIVLGAVRKTDSQEAYVVRLGSDAFKGLGSGLPWCKEGDKVRISKYSGDDLSDIEEGHLYRVIHDEDIFFVYEGENMHG